MSAPLPLVAAVSVIASAGMFNRNRSTNRLLSAFTLQRVSRSDQRFTY